MPSVVRLIISSSSGVVAGPGEGARLLPLNVILFSSARRKAGCPAGRCTDGVQGSESQRARERRYLLRDQTGAAGGGGRVMDLLLSGSRQAANTPTHRYLLVTTAPRLTCQ